MTYVRYLYAVYYVIHELGSSILYVLHSTGRMCTQDTQIAGFDIPRGTAVLLPIFNIHHDKAIWEDPETFKPERYR